MGANKDLRVLTLCCHVGRRQVMLYLSNMGSEEETGGSQSYCLLANQLAVCK